MTILVVTAVDAERDAVVRDLGPCEPIDIGGLPGVCVDTPAGPLHAVGGGIGPVAAAVTTANALASQPYELVVSAGIAGGFRDRITIGSLAVADYVTFADLGVRTETGFLKPRDIGLHAETTYAIAKQPIQEWLLAGPARVTHGEILTLACMTGTDADADELARRFPRAIAEAMEGFGVIEAVQRQPTIPRYVTEIRAISNLIGRRDPSTWDIPRAFDTLANAFATLVKEPLQ